MCAKVLIVTLALLGACTPTGVDWEPPGSSGHAKAPEHTPTTTSTTTGINLDFEIQRFRAEEMKSLRVPLRLMDEQVAELQQQLAAAHKERERRSRAEEALRVELSTQLRQMDEQVAELQQQLAAAHKERERKSRAEEALRGELSTQLRQMDQQVAELQRQLAAAQKEPKDRKAEAKADEPRSSASSEPEARSQVIKSLEAELTAAQQELKRRKAEIDQLNAKVDSLTTGRAELKQQVEDLAQAQRDATKDLRVRNQQIAQLSQELAISKQVILAALRWEKIQRATEEIPLLIKYVSAQTTDKSTNQLDQDKPAATVDLVDLLRRLRQDERRTQDSTENLTVLAALSGAILLFGSIFVLIILGVIPPFLRWQEHAINPLRQYSLQVLGISFILPVLLIISVALRLPSEAVTALLGAIIGSIFGSTRATTSGEDDKVRPNTEGRSTRATTSGEDDKVRPNTEGRSGSGP
jgi:hypothetical protein